MLTIKNLGYKNIRSIIRLECKCKSVEKDKLILSILKVKDTKLEKRIYALAEAELDFDGKTRFAKNDRVVIYSSNSGGRPYHRHLQFDVYKIKDLKSMLSEEQVHLVTLSEEQVVLETGA